MKKKKAIVILEDIMDTLFPIKKKTTNIKNQRLKN